MCICFVVNAYYTLKADTHLKDACWYLVQCLSKKPIVSVIHFLFPLKSNQNKFRILVILTKIRPDTKMPHSCLMSLPLDILITDDQIHKTKN